MNLESAKSQSVGIYDAFKDEVCEKCKIKIEKRLNELNKVQMAILIARLKNTPKRLGICQPCINRIHKKLLKNKK